MKFYGKNTHIHNHTYNVIYYMTVGTQRCVRIVNINVERKGKEGKREDNGAF